MKTIKLSFFCLIFFYLNNYRVANSQVTITHTNDLIKYDIIYDHPEKKPRFDIFISPLFVTVFNSNILGGPGLTGGAQVLVSNKLCFKTEYGNYLSLTKAQDYYNSTDNFQDPYFFDFSIEYSLFSWLYKSITEVRLNDLGSYKTQFETVAHYSYIMPELNKYATLNLRSGYFLQSSYLFADNYNKNCFISGNHRFDENGLDVSNETPLNSNLQGWYSKVFMQNFYFGLSYIFIKNYKLYISNYNFSRKRNMLNRIYFDVILNINNSINKITYNNATYNISDNLKFNHTGWRLGWDCYYPTYVTGFKFEIGMLPGIEHLFASIENSPGFNSNMRLLVSLCIYFPVASF